MIANRRLRKIGVRMLTPQRQEWLVKQLRRQARRFGYSLVPAPPPDSGTTTWEIWSWIRSIAEIRTIIDIGANDGEYAAHLGAFFSAEAVHAFEPLPACQPKLTALQARMPSLTVHQLALSDTDGAAPFFTHDFAPASSLLSASDLSRDAFPEMEGTSLATVRLARLDDVLPPPTLARDILVKIDVQGAEDRVIRGGRGVFSAARFVLIEMAFETVYEGQPLFEEVHDLLGTCGLRLAGIKNQIDNPQTGQPLFAHCLYRRPDGHTGS